MPAIIATDDAHYALDIVKAICTDFHGIIGSIVLEKIFSNGEVFIETMGVCCLNWR
jgi:hypothetical protein